ncbi:MAG: glutathione S-transferase N-terminal domain-containing protein [Actinomycetota bacterium]|nr:glutathione S-transferase N-terminal domain-containing protein [Actinomycetota bacterium]
MASKSKVKVKLYMFPGSNSVLTGRLMLDHKGVDYKLVKLPPGIHAFIMLALGFETMGVPAIKWGGRRVQGTRSISRALDELVPGRPLFPSDPAGRKATEDAERWGEELQNATRRIFYCAARRDRKAFMSVILQERALPMRVFLRVGGRLIIRLASGAHRASDDAAREDVALLPERLDQIDAWIDEGRLGGTELNAADFQIAVNISALLNSEDLAPLIEGRPAAALARRVVGDYGGHIGRVLPSEWLPSSHGSVGANGTADDTVVYDPYDRRAFLRSAGISEAKITELLKRN